MARPANEILADYEDEWAPRLRAVSLAAELQLDPRKVRTAVKCLGMMQRHRPERLGRYPASFVVALSGIGALEYDQGNFWSPVWAIAGVDGDGELAREWGRHYLKALERFRCPTFGHLPLRYVGPILLHAGVPRLSLGDLVDLVLRRADADAGLDGQGFVQWATEAGRQRRLASLDKPVQYFLREGGEFAIDWTDRLIDLLDRLRDASPDLDGVRLPAWVVEEVQKHVADKALRGRKRTTSTGTARASESVRLALDPYGLGVHLVLPPVGDQPDGTAVWHVSVDGVVQVLRSRAAWPGATQTVPGTTAVLSRPARTASASLGGSPLVSEVDVVDPQDPLLVFGDDGRRLPASLPLPPEPVWLLHPSAETGTVTYEGVAGAAEDGQVPYGWEGWSLARVDLSRVTRLRFGKSPWRAVRGSSGARLELPKPVPGVSTAYDSPVYASPPTLVLPATEGASAGWSVLVRRPGGATLRALDVQVADSVEVDVFAEVPRPLVGAYQVVVRGPLGRGLTREVQLVDGLVARTDPPWREFGARGLVPCSVTLTAGPGLELNPSSAQLGPNVEGIRFDARGGESHASLQIVPPHMAADLPGRGGSGRWSAGPLRLETETVGELESLVVRVPPELATAEIVLVRGEQELQRTSTPCRAGLARIDLRRFSDTLAGVASARFELELLRRRIPLATLRPRRLASDATIEEDVLRLDGAVAVDGLQAAAYPVLLPWRAPVVRPVGPGGEVPLGELAGLGRLLLHLRIEDPWLPTAWPEWPGRENTFRCEQPASRSLDGWEGDALSWLRGEGAPPEDPEAVPALLTVYGLHDQLNEAGVGTPVRDGVAAALAASPDAALHAAVTTTADARSVVPALVQAGLPLLGLPGSDVPAGAWARSALAAVLLSSDALVRGEDAAVDELVHAAGPVATSLLEGEPDPVAAAGRFGQDAAALAGMPKEAVDLIWQAANIVPTHLLDADSRVTAARQLFDVRARPGIRRVALAAQDVSDRVRAQLSARGRSGLAEAVQARSSAHGWQSLPAFSLALALAARLAARGDDDVRGLVEPHLELWATLARHAPDLVELDVVLAECLVLGANA